MLAVSGAGGGSHTLQVSKLEGSGIGSNSGLAYEFDNSTREVTTTTAGGLSTFIVVARPVLTRADGEVFTGVIINHGVTTPSGQSVSMFKIVGQ